MKPNKYPEFRLIGALFALISLCPASFAQGTAAEPGIDEDVVVLSPFSVEASEDNGYRATNTLAGTRIKSELRDLGASISVYTKDFLEDTGSTDLEDLLVYAVGAEVDGINGSFTSATTEGNFGTVDFGSVAFEDQTRARVRGLADATRTRNYYESLIPVDSYNVERVAVNRGANSTLFGLGSPAGIINQGLSNVRWDGRNEVQLRVDDFGSTRAIADFSKVIVEDRLAVRLIGLDNNRRYRQDDAFRDESRLYGTVDFKITPSTLLRINGETGEMDSTPPLNAPIRDRFTNWWDPAIGQATVPAGVDGRDRDGAAGLADDTIDGTVVPLARLPTLFFDGNAASIGFPTLFQTNANDMNNADLTNPANGLTVHPGSAAYEASFTPTFSTLNDRARILRGDNSVAENDFTRSPQLQDTSVFNYNNDLLEGPNSSKHHDIAAYNVSLQQQFWKGRVGVELAYDSQTFESGNISLLGGGFRNRTINIDLNETLIDGTPNPNVGRAFIAGFPEWNERETELETKRAIAYADLDFEELFGDSAKFLGEHLFTTIYEERSRDFRTYGGSMAVADVSYGQVAGYRSGDIEYDDRMRLGYVHYLDAAVDDFRTVSSPAGAGLRGINERIQWPDTLQMIFIDDDGLFQRSTFDIHNYFEDRDIVTTRSDIERWELDSLAVTLQSKFFNENLITTLGWRRDDYIEWDGGQADTDQFKSHILSTLSIDEATDVVQEAEDEIFSWGTVFHLPETWLPESVGVSLFYNESENFIPQSSIKPIAAFEGERFDSQRGETEDFGLSVSLFDGKLNARATWYETNQDNQPNRSFRQVYDWFFERIPRTVINSSRVDYDDIIASGFLDALPVEGVQIAWEWELENDPAAQEISLTTTSAQHADINNSSSEGFEFDLTWNPSRQIRLFFNASQQKAFQTGIAATGFAEVERLYNLWRNDPVIFGLMTQARVQSRLDQQFLRIVEQASLSGKAVDDLREWRANFGGNYQFASDSVLKGFSVGGAIRWQDSVVIGYPVIDPDGIPETLDNRRDLDSPVFGPSDTKVDLWIGYKTKLNESVDFSLRLNIRNLLDEDDLIPTQLNYSGLPNVVRFTEGRRFSLTSKFSF